ncbi:hypothetical protein AB0G02_19735 [Actinosynnema sp. NPDC023658]|uniref:hypothetical protein n=1 Tax=Actinosynnema sp. NPDC023658 TaxID=3155465 RepID=UPI0033C857D5
MRDDAWPPAAMETDVYLVLWIARDGALYIQTGASLPTAWTSYSREPACRLTPAQSAALAALLDRGVLVRTWGAALIDEADEVISADAVEITATGREMYERLQTPSQRR